MAPQIYSKSGDAGETSLLVGGRIQKDALRIECAGNLDETNAHLGVVRAALRQAGGEAAALADVVLRVQTDLLDLGAVVASVGPSPAHRASFEEATKALESDIDAWHATLPDLRSFVIPGGGPVSAAIQVARTVCRRAERKVCRLAATTTVRSDVLAYLNRLSDALFVMARRAGQLLGEEEQRKDRR